MLLKQNKCFLAHLEKAIDDAMEVTTGWALIRISALVHITHIKLNKAKWLARGLMYGHRSDANGLGSYVHKYWPKANKLVHDITSHMTPTCLAS